MKLNLFKKNKKTKSINLRKVSEIDPFFYWKRILILMLVVLIFTAIASFTVYYLANRDFFVTNESKEKVKSLVVVELNENKLNEIFTKFEERSAVRADIIKNKPAVPDPSKNRVVVPPVVDTETKTPVTR